MPARELADNEVFNKHVSRLRIRSEHAIGFLKGRFHSWVAACVGIHAYAMRCEEEERGGDDLDSDNPDPFIAEGLSSDGDSSDAEGNLGRRAAGADRLTNGKLLREALKERLFRAKEKRTRRRAARRAEELGV
ncbi:hypothetical protein B0H16DRAFT_1599621 [Mycena metata]|uniref:DDE Tnp4 domain-containing protein n=1 Tax=Mycena metata TaxID=1033252 RepID=A0AAD7MIA1_9AGAR|nr:hypothetical protein B0H16DRAFT_1608444 [Mycena metata]KAJ7722965.1 hypothetical protein B0H16DRAFT_1599621 [Mycena metata]